MDGTGTGKTSITGIVEKAADHLVVHIEREGKLETLAFIVLPEGPPGIGQELLAALARHATGGQAAKE